MSLGGGTFTSQNKVIPGAYLNFVSLAQAALGVSDRGVVAVPLNLDWGPESTMFELNVADVASVSLKTLGYYLTDASLKDVRELFKHATKVYAYRLNGGGTKASVVTGNLTCTAKYGGTRGNSLKVVITVNVNDAAKWDVTTYLGSDKVDAQIQVANIAGLVNNDYITFSGSGVLAATAGATLTGGTNKTVTGTDYQAFLDRSEAFAYNVMICPTTDSTTIALFVAHNKRRRDDNGVKVQLIVYRTYSDYEGIISVENTVTDGGANAWSMVYWVGGAEAAAAINKSTTNMTYDGEYTVDTNYTQAQLEANVKAGKFMLHKVGGDTRVLTDINTIVTYTASKNSDFASNQVIRVLDQIGNDIASIFNNEFNGKVPNDKSGRVSLWNRIVSQYREYEKMQAIENFDPADITVDAGADKKSVLITSPVDPVTAMEKLYMTVVVQ